MPSISAGSPADRRRTGGWRAWLLSVTGSRSRLGAGGQEDALGVCFRFRVTGRSRGGLAATEGPGEEPGDGDDGQGGTVDVAKAEGGGVRQLRRLGSSRGRGGGLGDVRWDARLEDGGEGGDAERAGDV